MMYRGLYCFLVAEQKGLTTNPVQYFSTLKNPDLGIVQQQQKPNVKIIIALFPDNPRSSLHLFLNFT
jgi:hypothetical protein